MSKRSRLRRRRAVSTIVGGFFFLILMVGTFAAVFAALELQSDLVDTQREIAEQEGGKSKERFAVRTAANPNVNFVKNGDRFDKLAVQVENLGSTTVEIVDLLIVNQSIANRNATLFSIINDDGFVPTNANVSIIKSQSLFLSPGRYDIKAVSSLGNIAVDELTVPFRPLNVTLYAIPPSVTSGGNITLVMQVFNRGNTTLFNVTPNTVTVDPATAVPTPTSENLIQIPPLSVTALEPGESALFTWSIKVFGAIGTIVKISNSATGIDFASGTTVTSNTPTTRSVFIPSPKLLFQAPEIFLVIPSPFGDTSDAVNSKGLWGLVVANPTDTTLNITRVVISIFSQGSTNDFLAKDKCGSGANFAASVVQIFPTSEWSCPIRNVIQWSSTTPQVVDARGIQHFLVRSSPGGLTGGATEPAAVVVGSVFTSFGTFAKTGLVTSADDNKATIANVYLTSDPTDELNNAKMAVNFTGIASGVTKQLNVTLADFSAGSSTVGLAAGTKMIINVPPGFKVTDLKTDCVTPTDIPTAVTAESPFKQVKCKDVNEFADGSTQILTVLNSALGTAGAEAASTVKIKLDAPIVSSKALYTLFVLAEGLSTDNFAIGPLGEIAVQVLPPP